MLAEALVFGVLQVTVTIYFNTNTLMYCEKFDNFSRIINIRYKGNVMGILVYEASLCSIESTKLQKHRLLNVVEKGRCNSLS
jgi:hypothetical protein